jgi:hypothetical protein
MLNFILDFGLYTEKQRGFRRGKRRNRLELPLAPQPPWLLWPPSLSLYHSPVVQELLVATSYSKEENLYCSVCQGVLKMSMQTEICKHVFYRKYFLTAIRQRNTLFSVSWKCD